MTPPVVPSIEIVIEAVQFTPGRDAMLVQFAAKDPTHPLLGKGRQVSLTQRAISGEPMDSPIDLATLTWGDAECEAALVATIAGWGISAVVVANEEPQPPKGVTKEESIVPKDEEPIDVPIDPIEPPADITPADTTGMP